MQKSERGVKLSEFIPMLGARAPLKSYQVKNVKRIKEVAEKFHKDVGTYECVKHVLKSGVVAKDVLVLETGHQPNFMPYAGVWRKAFLLDFLAKKIAEGGRACVAIFGFADYNLCTAKWIYQNRIPSATKDGFETIGFKISGKDRWKRFDCISKPSEDEWASALERITAVYKKCCDDESIKNLEAVKELLWRCYESAKSFSDVNAFFLSKVCNELWGLEVLFFRYSDVQRAGIFVEEWEKIISQLSKFNELHDEIVREKGLEDIGYCGRNSVPFWYHCSCGGKVPLFMDSPPLAYGECPVCGEMYELNLESLKELFGSMSPNAITRNLVFSEGLGVALFISGAGGGLRYGLVSDGISKELGFNVPVTLMWRGRDYYLGAAHRAALNGLMKAFGLNPDDFLDEDTLILKAARKREMLASEIRSLEDELRVEGGGKSAVVKKLKRCRGQYISTDTQTKVAGKVFSLIPSILDVFVSVGVKSVPKRWEAALSESIEVSADEFYSIEKDVVYGDDSVPLIYRSVQRLYERNKEIDPLGILKPE
ncbi:hypothetical protein [Candidatus Alkanophaga liquidiphilum]